MYSEKNISVAIVFGGVCVALLLTLVNGTLLDFIRVNDGLSVVEAAERTNNPHTMGDKNSAITIVEFSDFECPYCARLHPILSQIVKESNGGVSWEFRHLPLPNHTHAEAAAYAGECIAKLAGNEAFWAFAQNVFSHQRELGTGFFESEAKALGINEEDFRTCVASENIKSTVLADRAAAVAHGAAGTPFSIIVYSDGGIQPVSGALPYNEWKRLLSL
jgi:protein-disulfide isomerase